VAEPIERRQGIGHEQRDQEDQQQGPDEAQIRCFRFKT
jgi:hypothetical protein